MSYGLRVFNGAGTTVLDTLRRGAVFLEQFSTTGNTAATRSYPQATGRTIFVVALRGQLSNGTWTTPYSISYPGGVPTVSFNAVPGPATYWIFTR